MKTPFLKLIPIVIIVALLGWGISSRATDDIKSATANFSVLGTVSEISRDGITISDAKGSDKSGKTSYVLNISHLEEMEMNTYVPLNFTDIKVGDRIIAQGLTNGDTFFIKRIISFTSTPTPVLPKDDVATSSATTTDEVASSTATTTEEVSASSTTTGSEVSSATTTATSTEADNATTTGTTTEMDNSSTTTEVGTSTSIIETVTNVVQEIVQTVTDTVQTVVGAVTGSSSGSDPEATSTQ